MAKHGKRPARTDGRVSAPDEPGAPVFADIWEAIEPTPEAAAVARACSNLMDATIAKVESWRLTQREAAKRLGVTQPRLNQLLKGKINQFSLEALVELAMRAGLKVNIAVHDGRRAA
jgi:predicted XRE-type DNA-binding protein